VGRVAEHNAYSHPDHLLGTIGIGLNDLWAGQANVQALAHLYGVAANAMAAITPQAVGLHAVKISGLVHMQGEINRTACRVSPIGLQRSLHHRLSWSMRHFPFCPEDFQLLLSECPADTCQTPLAWSNGPIHLCSRCGFDLRTARTEQVGEAHRPYLDVAAGLVSFDQDMRRRSLSQLPAFLGELTAKEGFRVVRTIGRVLKHAGHPLADAPRTSSPYPIVMLAGMRLLLDGHAHDTLGFHQELAPESFVKKVRENWLQFAGRNTRSVRTALSRARQQIPILQSPRAPKAAAKPRVVATPKRRIPATPKPAKKRKIARKRQIQYVLDGTGAVNLTTAARMLGVERCIAKKLLKIGLLRGRVQGGGPQRVCHLIEEASVLALVEEAASRVSLSHLAMDYGVKSSMLMEMAARGVLEIAQSPFIDAVYKELQFWRASATAVLDGLIGAIQRTPPSDDGRVLLSDAFVAMGPGLKPWSQALMVPGDIPDGLGSFEPDGARLAALNVSRQCAEGLRSGRFAFRPVSSPTCSEISLSAAQEHLNCYPRDISDLIQGGALRRSGKAVSLKSVEACKRRFISTRELAARARLPALDVAAIARAKGLEHTFPAIGLWPRDEAEVAFDLEPFVLRS
jgi:hypothetical protein